MSVREHGLPPEAIFPQRRPGTILRGLRWRDGLSQAALASLAGIPRRRISAMERGTLPIDGQAARALAAALRTDPRMFYPA